MMQIPGANKSDSTMGTEIGFREMLSKALEFVSRSESLLKESES